MNIEAVLFDLDGTLADTAPDMALTVNRMLASRGMAAVAVEQVRPFVSRGARGMVCSAFGIATEHPDFNGLREEFLRLYGENLCVETRLFPGMAELLELLEAQSIAWGVVTNKFERFARPIIDALGLGKRAAVIVGGDTCPRAEALPRPAALRGRNDRSGADADTLRGRRRARRASRARRGNAGDRGRIRIFGRRPPAGALERGRDRARRGRNRKMDRRSVLKWLSAAPLAATMPARASPSSPGDRLLVLVFLYGGNDTFNTWVPYTDPTYYRVRPNIAVNRDAVLKITDRHGFHPSLAALMPVWDAKELALVQGIGMAGTTQQHIRDCEIAFTANDEEIVTSGWVTRVLARRAPAAGLADAIALGELDVRQSDPMGPFRGDRLGVIQVHWAHELLEKRRIADCVIDANTRGTRAGGA